MNSSKAGQDAIPAGLPVFAMPSQALVLSALLFSAILFTGQAEGEDWSSIHLPANTLQPAKPLLGEVDHATGFTRQLIQLQWRPVDPVYLYVMLPDLVAKPPVILFLYNYDVETDRFLNEKFCQTLVKDGFAAVGFPAALSGPRYHDRPMKEWFVSELQESLGSTTHDVSLVLDYLAKRNDLDMNRIGMFGEGSGAAVAVLAAAADPRIKAIDLLNPWGDWPNWLAKSSVVPDAERATYLKPEFLAKVEPLDPVHWLPQVKIPVRLQYINAGATIPAEAQARIEAAAPAQALKIPSAQALTEYKATSGAHFLDWIHQQLRPAP